MGRRGSMVKDSAEACEPNGMGDVGESPPPCEGLEAPSENILPSLEWDKNLNLCGRLLIAQSMGAKLKETPGKNGMKYAFVTHSDITSEAKRILNKNGILFFPTIQDFSQDANRTVATVKAVFVNADKPEETMETIGFGYGCDNQDKGPGKAYSYAVKFILAKTLMLNTSDDDVEQHDIDYTPTQIAEKTEHEIKSWFKSFSDQIDHTQSYEQLKKLKTDNTAMLKSPAVPDTTKEAILEKLDAKIDLAKEVLLQDEVS